MRVIEQIGFTALIIVAAMICSLVETIRDTARIIRVLRS
jgi:hypothetical protein